MSLRGAKIPAGLKLWKHQSEAIEKVRGYLSSKDKGAALVRIPTGAGKTGVIAVLAQAFPDTPNVLVVCPWAALREQLMDEIRESFWRKAGVKNGSWRKGVESITPSKVEAKLRQTRDKSTVFVGTIQTLQTIHSKQPKEYAELKRRLSFVIVDEGHREPAPDWAAAVRGLERPTLLLTATPYRNDHKMFNVNPGHVYVYSHQQAVTDRYIREVSFCEFRFPLSPEGFLDALLEYFRGPFQDLVPPGIKAPRVIIRCETGTDVNRIATLLRRSGESVVAIHDRFKDEEEEFRRYRVPDPEKIEAVFWVHQNKLIEGIDDSSFCLLALYQPFWNARALVQQVGRILRNPRRLTGQVAWVFSHPDHPQRSFWNSYRKYEEVYETNPDRYELQQLFNLTVGVQPLYQYFEGNYRERFNPESIDLYRRLTYRPTTNVYSAGEDFSLEKLRDSILKEWEDADLDVRMVENPDSYTFVVVYVTYENSPILSADALVEFKLGYTIFRRIRGYVFYYDSRGNHPSYLFEQARPVDPGRLQRLYDQWARLSQL